MWPNVVDFVKAIKEHSHCIVTLTTNGSRTLRWWHDNVKHFDHIGLSVHHESADADHLSQVGDIIYNNKVSMWATVLMDPAYWNKCIDIISTLKNSRYKWSITADQIHHPTINYSEDQLKYLQKRQQRENSILYEFFVCRLKRPHYPNPTIYFDNKSKTVPNHWLLLNGFNNFKGWECNLGVDTLFIDKRGQLKGTCGNKLYNEVFYYNIYDTDFINAFKPAIQPVICEMTRCVCQPEVNCTKSLH
jgi:hypothetical protein